EGGFHKRADHQNPPQACISPPPWSHEITRICGGPISGHFGQPMAALAGPRGKQPIQFGGRLRSSVTLPSGMVYYLTGLRKSNRNSRDLSQISASHLRNDGQPDRVLVSKREGE
ncbi:hypothetical protein CCUS01_13075, partial [Colletotrichum cuscutae]